MRVASSRGMDGYCLNENAPIKLTVLALNHFHGHHLGHPRRSVTSSTFFCFFLRIKVKVPGFGKHGVREADGCNRRTSVTDE